MATYNKSQLPEEITCPVCMELLARRIFQCKNGHIICVACVDSLTDCPQCRVSYKGSPIRNLALETVLDQMNFKCKYSGIGCCARLNRKDVLTHEIDCSYGCPKVNICRILGYQCDQEFKSTDVCDASRHIQFMHRICKRKILPTKQLEIELWDSLPTDRDRHISVRKFWDPILINDEDSPRELLIRIASWMDVNSQSLMVDVIVIKMEGFGHGDEDPIEMEFSMLASESVNHCLTREGTH